MDRGRFVEAIVASRASLAAGTPPVRKADAEGGCGVIGLAASVPVAGRHLLQALTQMRNRGNGKGGGIAAVGLDAARLGVTADVLAQDYLLAVALLDPSAWDEVRREHVEPTFTIDHEFELPRVDEWRDIAGLEVAPPRVMACFVRVRPEVRERFPVARDLDGDDEAAIEDEIVYQNTYRLNAACYASTGDKRAFVLSHGKDLLVLKMVGYGDDVIRAYRLEDFPAHVWIGHHRYPTKGRVWHPGGAHPFIGMHEALVHNGDFANYASMAAYLAQRNIRPLFLTDTEVAVLVYDLLHRTYGYPLEYVIEAMAPTTERDFARLPEAKRRVYRMLQTVHIHGSPDGPWFFLIAGHDPASGACRLIGITDTSMLRPQVFALQRGEASIGFAASEKQGIDAALESLAREDARFWTHCDMVWNARGGSHTDGGAFVFTVERSAAGSVELVCTDKFGRAIEPPVDQKPPSATHLRAVTAEPSPGGSRIADAPAGELSAEVEASLSRWGYERLEALLGELVGSATSDEGRERAIEVLTRIVDRRVPTGAMKRSGVVALASAALEQVFEDIARQPSPAYVSVRKDDPLPGYRDGATVVLDARGVSPEGPRSAARRIVDLVRSGFTRLIVAGARGHRFIGCGLPPGSEGVRIDVYGSSGDYLGSGIDGAEVVVHGSAQDQLAQIMKAGTLVVHGDVGQTFGYAAKGGLAFILGNAAGRPLINAVGRPRVVINGTCLDYLAESFMAGDPLAGGGFVVLNGVRFDERGALVELDTPYPGGNLFSLASGGAIYLRDPFRRVDAEQLNGGAFAALTGADWELIRAPLEDNERLFGIAVERLLAVEGRRRAPEEVYRKIAPSSHKALAPEEAWVGAHR